MFKHELHFATLLSLTLLFLTGYRKQISSLVYAVCPGIVPVFVIPHNKFVALYK